MKTLKMHFSYFFDSPPGGKGVRFIPNECILNGIRKYGTISGWWFGTFFIFFKMVNHQPDIMWCTTNMKGYCKTNNATHTLQLLWWNLHTINLNHNMPAKHKAIRTFGGHSHCITNDEPQIVFLILLYTSCYPIISQNYLHGMFPFILRWYFL